MSDGEDDNVHTAEDAAADGAAIDAQQADADLKAQEPLTVEAIAQKLGWSPKDKWRGDDANWRDAAEFIEHATNETKSLRRSVKRLEETTQRMTRAQEAAMDRALAAQKAQLQREFEQAVEDGDKAAASRAGKELAKLDQEPSPISPSTDVQDFVERNASWFQKDPEATDYAISVSQRLAAQGKTEAEQVAEAERLTRKRFPELFDEPKPARKPAPGVNEPGTRAASLGRRERGFSDLPPEAKKAWEKFDSDFKKRGFADGYPREDYASEFWADRDKRNVA